ncbi:peptide-methionine (S)-S-oxide reductase [Mycoplasmopsis maculosa]|uniref:Peptide methionine sulfoxide reductase MsrA n=1 Tax=Mycoplasmopsis maculosa TaxID=114885 RepID=A0A449B3U5_9BACT|nr:peptide-methionine (S)-S-oxide reductase MsrA [Mycoplasmopsis maculosa]VEU75208.1 peptide-methionine (S)-S-oxide reductase [Mycoplasmopsis maculosa]
MIKFYKLNNNKLIFFKKEVSIKKEIVLAGGCFWGMEAYFKKINGVEKTIVAYTNGKTPNTNYEFVKLTNHTESLYIQYEDEKIRLAEILTRFINLIDPYSLNKQGNDIGTQYRSGIYFFDEKSKKITKNVIKQFEKTNGKKVVLEFENVNNFVIAEEYHQNYLEKNPGGYCHINVSSLYLPFDKTNDNLFLKTESSIDINNSKKGLYLDKVTNQALFMSNDLISNTNNFIFFKKPITTDAVFIRDEKIYSNISKSEIGILENNFYKINKNKLTFLDFNNLNNTFHEQYIPFFEE